LKLRTPCLPAGRRFIAFASFALLRLCGEKKHSNKGFSQTCLPVGRFSQMKRRFPQKIFEKKRPLFGRPSVQTSTQH
jgi:hypothetical protein